MLNLSSNIKTVASKEPPSIIIVVYFIATVIVKLFIILGNISSCHVK